MAGGPVASAALSRRCFRMSNFSRLLLLAWPLITSATCANVAGDLTPEGVHGRLKELLREEYSGQDMAKTTARVMVQEWMKRVGKSRPTGACESRVVHFTGPSGTGKTLLASLIARSVFLPVVKRFFGFFDIPLDDVGGDDHCGVTLTTFKGSARNAIRQAKAWEHEVAEALKLEPKTVVVADDMSRLAQGEDGGEAFRMVGDLMCGVNVGPPKFRTAEGELVDSSQALFIITSDMSIGADAQLDCDASTIEARIKIVRAQIKQFNRNLGIELPAAWEKSRCRRHAGPSGVPICGRNAPERTAVYTYMYMCSYPASSPMLPPSAPPATGSHRSRRCARGILWRLRRGSWRSFGSLRPRLSRRR